MRLPSQCRPAWLLCNRMSPVAGWGMRTASPPPPRLAAASLAIVWLLVAAACTPPSGPPLVPTADATPAAEMAPPGANASRPLPFEGQSQVPAKDWFEAMQSELASIAQSTAVRDEFERLRQKHQLPDDAGLFADYVIVRTAFEATRAGGLWGLEWRVTDQLPQSDRIWSQWRSAAVADDELPATTAIAECDELSALFAVVARGLGLSRRSRAGLLWPTSNHTVAVWAFDLPFTRDGHTQSRAEHRREVRIVVPTSQIFLDSAQSLDTDGFDPWVQPRIFDYTRRDVPPDFALPADLARAFVGAVRMHGSTSAGVLQSMRNRRAYLQRQRARSTDAQPLPPPEGP